MERIKLYFIAVLSSAVFLASQTAWTALTPPLGLRATVRAVHALGNAADITVTDVSLNDAWLHVSLLFHDEPHPLIIDIVGSLRERPRKVAYFLPGGTSFESSFFTPTTDNLAHHYRRHGRLIVGITPREAAMTGADDFSVMATWGLGKHREDIRRITDIVQAALRLPFELVGWSIGGEYALDYAAAYPGELSAVTVLGLESFDPDRDSVSVAWSSLVFDAAVTLMDEGVFNDDSLSGFKDIVEAAMIYPTADSGESRAPVGMTGNFTFAGLLHFTAMFTGMLPGFHSQLTGLPGEWWNVSHLAGSYSFAEDPAEDRYDFYFTDDDTLTDGVLRMKSGYVPLAVLRDNASLNAYNGVYTIDWDAIDAPVTWINGEAGMGDLMYAATRIRDAGNDNVDAIVLPGYGHADLTWSRDAKDDLWPLLPL